MTTALEGARGQRHAPAAFYPRERTGTHCAGGWVGPRAGMDGYGKSRLYRDLIPGFSSPYRVAIIIIATAWNIMGRLNKRVFQK